MKLKVILFFIPFIVWSCQSEPKKSVPAGPLISNVDKKKIENQEVDSAVIKSNPNYVDPKTLINNENVSEKLTRFGEENPETKVKIVTKLGSIKIRLFKDTPLHRANFIMLIKKNYFDSTLFYRVINNFMIQGGNSDRDNTANKMRKIGSYQVPEEIKHIHKRGALAMAVQDQWDVPEDRRHKNSSPYNFYIVQQKPLSDSYMDKMEERYKITIDESKRKIYRKYGGVPHLDGNFTVFGEVYSGMSVVDKIANASTDAYDRPREDIFLSIEIIE